MSDAELAALKNATLPIEQRVLLLEMSMQRLDEERAEEKETRKLENAAILEALHLLRKDVAAVQKIIWTGIGILSAVTFTIQLIKH